LEGKLTEKGDDRKLGHVQRSSELADVHLLRQGEPKGLGHAVFRAKAHVGDSPFAVMLGDDLIDERDPLLPKMIEVNEQRGAMVIALMEVDPDQISMYGCASVEATDDPDVVKVLDLVEKPAKEDAPSNLAIIGRYLLTPEIFPVLEHTQPGKGNEIQLTDALKEVAADENNVDVYGVIFRGRRYDTG